MQGVLAIPFTIRFTWIVATLNEILAARASQTTQSTRNVLFVFFDRINRLQQRIATLAARLEAGKSIAPRPRPATKPTTTTPEATPEPAPPRTKPRPLRLPRTPGWLLKHMPEATAWGEFLSQALLDPQMQEIAEKAPQILRPYRAVLRMLVKKLPAPLALPPRPRRPRVRRAPTTSPTSARKPARIEYWRPGKIRPHWA